MSHVDEQGRPEPDLAVGKAATILGYLDFLRATIRWKTDGLSDDQLHARRLPSSMSLGGLLKHLAYVEDFWFWVVLGGNRPGTPWCDVDWKADRDWDWDSAQEDTGDALRQLCRDACEASRRRLDALGGVEGVDPDPDRHRARMGRGSHRPLGAGAHGGGVRPPLRASGPAARGHRRPDGRVNDGHHELHRHLHRVAEDCPLDAAEVPAPTKKGPNIASLQYELLAGNPYELTSDDLIFSVHARRHEIPEALQQEARADFFARSQACLRSSPLGKRYGWGLHHDAEGRVALVALGSARYDELLADTHLTQTRALRTSRPERAANPSRLPD